MSLFNGWEKIKNLVRIKFREYKKMVVIDVKSDEEFLDHISEPGLAIVDFTAKWCQPCQAIKPTYERHSFLFRGMRFLKLDVDDVQNVASSAGVRSLPT